MVLIGPGAVLPVQLLVVVGRFVLAAASVDDHRDAYGGVFVGQPIWAKPAAVPDGGQQASQIMSTPEFVLFRKTFEVPPALQAKIVSATLQVTAQASPDIDAVDSGNLPKLLGAYKLALDGQFLAMGPGQGTLSPCLPWGFDSATPLCCLAVVWLRISSDGIVTWLVTNTKAVVLLTAYAGGRLGWSESRGLLYTP